MNSKQQNLDGTGMDKNKLEERMESLRNRLKTIEWDMKLGAFSKGKIPYYKRLLQEYEEMKNKMERA